GEIVQGLPAGAIDSAESPETCAKRELEEETGFIGGTFFHTGTAYPNPATQDNKVHSYLALGVTPGGKINFDPGENIEVVPVPFKDLLELSVRVGLPFQSIHIAAFHQTLMFALRSNHPALSSLRELILETFENF